MKTALFLISLLLISSYALTLEAESSTNSIKLPFNGEKFHLLITVQQEMPHGRDVYRDENGLDILGMSEFYGLSENVEKFIAKKVGNLKNLLRRNNLLTEHFLDATSTSFATHDLNGESSLEFFLEFGKQLFKDEGRNFFIKPKTLTNENKQDFFAQTHDNLDLIELINFTYGYYRKSTGLNLTPGVCPAIKQFLEEKWRNGNEFKTALAVTGHDKLVDYLSNHFQNKTFNGTSINRKTWSFVGKTNPLKNSGIDLFKFLDTFNYDSQGRIDEIPVEKHAELLKLREHFMKFYLGKFADFVGQRFFSFVLELLNLREEFSNGLSHKAIPLKKWLILGSSDIGVFYLSKFLENELKIKFDSVEVGKTINLFFTGDAKTIKHVHIYYNDDFMIKATLKDILKHAPFDFHNHVAFNKLCINKENVESYENDF